MTDKKATIIIFLIIAILAVGLANVLAGITGPYHIDTDNNATFDNNTTHAKNTTTHKTTTTYKSTTTTQKYTTTGGGGNSSNRTR